METNYGVGISNRYNLFLDEDADPLEILKIQEEEKQKAAKEKAVAKDVKVPKGKGTKPAPKKDDAAKKPVRPVAALVESNRGEVGRPRPDVGRRDENRPAAGPRFEGREDSGRGGFRGRGGGVFRGGRGRGGDRVPSEARGKREYERHSGTDKTGVKAVEKREGGGARNWGRATDNYENADWTNTDENVNAAGQTQAPKETTDENKESPTKSEENKDETGAGDETAEKEAEPQEITLTLEEWKAQQAEQRNRPTFNIRRAGEGEDPKQWKNTFVLKKKQPLSDEESDDDDEEDEDEEVARQQALVNQIQFVFTSGPARRGGGRGRGRGGRGGGAPSERGRGGGRFEDRPSGGRGGGGGRFEGRDGGRFEDRPGGGRGRGGGNQSAPKVDDENDFPSL